eukprot:TRINITY_DN6057_c0_g1_i1.p1 TRINITY_DN6057_c0_g1~~TRINITY_DN6057_c0_g1_i1.p1  ORF type:complete len:627 (-),score=103.35 TRINITY_DN6057_c0_g1_i1:45-1925(-)
MHKLIAFIVLLSVIDAQVSPNALKNTISTLLTQITEAQIKESQNYIPPFISEQKLKGLYPSYVHLNFHGEPEMTALRRDVKFFDNNMFVTNWVTQVLLEFDEFGIISVPPSQISLSINTLVQFRDKNLPKAYTEPLYSFWQQILQNGTWTAWPTNIAEPLVEYEDLGSVIIEFLKSIGLGFLVPTVKTIFEGLPKFLLSAFIIPPDTDDSSCNLALGALLSRSKDRFSDSWNVWYSENSNFSSLAREYVLYSYKPFATDLDDNEIDPRTYFWLKDFIWLENAPLYLVATWLQDISEDRKEFSGVKMPFNCNNVDLSVSANTIFGLSSTLVEKIGNPEQWFNRPLQKLYNDTGRMLGWAIKSGAVLSRPDLALLYYPPIYDFYWFVSRTVFLLNNEPTLPFSVMLDVRDYLTNAMRNEGTQQLISSSQLDSKNQDWSYWDDFLGDGDTIFGFSENRAEDRLFSTSVAVNALIDTWSESSSTCSRKWLPQTPIEVKNLVDRAVNFLQEFILGTQYLKENAFFSGSVKSSDCLPFGYPTNFQQYVNGTKLPPNPGSSYISDDLINVVSGVISKPDYLKMLNETHFGENTPLTFKGYNLPEDYFPYWSSPTFTDATTMLALTKYLVLISC